MGHSDKLLERLAKRVNESGEFLDITIMLGGGVITGKLAPRANWLQGNADALEETPLAEFAADFRHEGQAFGSDDYLHLSSAKVMFGDIMLPGPGAAIRVPLSEVSGWMVGRMQLKDLEA